MGRGKPYRMALKFKIWDSAMKGIFQLIQESEPYVYKEPSKEEFIEMMEKLQAQHEALRKHLAKLEDEWAKHWARKQKENGEEPPLWLMLMTAPSNNMLNHGVFYTSREFLDKHKKWLL